jgi:nucleotide-binding universal stress UspA family protein
VTDHLASNDPDRPIGDRRILLAYDGTEGAKRALSFAAELGAALRAPIGVISVAPERPNESTDDPRGEASIHAGLLHEATRTLGAAGVTTQTHEPTGAVGPMIVEVAEAFGYDTIVVGSRDMGTLKRAVLGSVSTYVATHATATVIIARGRT